MPPVLTPQLTKLNQQLDTRLVNTFLDLFRLIVIHRERHQGLILSELGGELLGEAHAPAGSKRIGNLLRSPRWQVAQIDEALWHTWEARRKFLLIASLVHAFLILLLAPRFEHLKLYLLDAWCHRNGEWSRETPTPFYRLRLALSHLWREFPRVNQPC